jgi:dienelactone hydrolase
LIPLRWGIALVVVVLFVLLLPRTAPVRTIVLTAELVPSILGLLPEEDAAADGPRVESTTYGTPVDRMDVWLPPGAHARFDGDAHGARLPAVVLALGVHPQPIDHPDITRVARAIAGAGVVVGVPDSTPLRELRVTPDEPAHLADAYLVLASRAEVDPRRVGLAGFSAGASMAILAAADPRIASDIRYVSAFGAYADAERLLADVATRTTRAGAGVKAWQPDPGIRRDVLELMLVAIEDEPGVDRLRELLPPVVAADAAPAGPDHAVAASLGGDSRGVYLLFTAADRAAAEAAVESLSVELREQLAGISPLTVEYDVETHVFLLHGLSDNAIPVEHADLLQAALTARVVRSTRFGTFGHEQPGLAGLDPDDAGDIWALALYLRDIVAAATE